MTPIQKQLKAMGINPREFPMILSEEDIIDETLIYDPYGDVTDEEE